MLGKIAGDFSKVWALTEINSQNTTKAVLDVGCEQQLGYFETTTVFPDMLGIHPQLKGKANSSRTPISAPY